MRAITLVVAVLVVGCGAVWAQSKTGHEGHAVAAPALRVQAQILTPAPIIGDVPLVDSANRPTSLREAVDADGPVFVNFVFTSCTTICPVMSAGFAQLREDLGAGRDRVRLVSISIDPNTDTVDILRAYARQYRAGASWRFLTGSPASVEAAQRAFGAYRGDKSNHAPATYFRRGRAAQWQVLNGLASAEALIGLVRGSL